MHTERPVKVNAWVDSGIAPVVESLNEFSEVETISSCEGDGHSYFYVRGDGDALYHFIAWLATELSEQIDACCEFRLSLEWTGSHAAHGALYVANEATKAISNALTEISRRRNQCSDGKPS